MTKLAIIQSYKSLFAPLAKHGLVKGRLHCRTGRNGKQYQFVRYKTMFKDTPDGQTHYENDGCGIKEHNITPPDWKEKIKYQFKLQKESSLKGRVDGTLLEATISIVESELDNHGTKEYERGKKEARAHYYDLVRKEATEEALSSFKARVIEQLDELRGKEFDSDECVSEAINIIKNLEL